MRKIDKTIWFLIILISVIQRREKIECFVFLAIVYLIVKKMINILFKEKTKKKETKKRYKYEEESENNEKGKYLLEKKEENIDEEIKEILEKSNKRKEKTKEYDFREFEGRENVTWEEVEDYLWIHCKYKGYEMWTEYCMYLVSKGIILKSDIEKIFEKHRKNISIMPRPDLEAKEEKEREEERWFWNKQERIDKHDEKLINDENWNYMNKDGTIHNIFADLGCGNTYNFKRDTSESSLKRLFYDEYLKKKGYI